MYYNNKFQAGTGTSKQKQTTINTRIICRYNYLSTKNYNHFRQFVQTSNLVEPHVFSFFSSFEDRLSFIEIFSHNPNSNSSHTQRDNTLLVTFLNQSITIDSTVDLSILLHLRVRVTGCTGLRSCREQILAQQSSRYSAT